MVNILAFAEVSNIAGVHINMDISKEKVINIQIQYGIIIQFKACAEGLFYTKIDDPSMITNPTNVSVNTYSYLSTVKQSSYF